MLKTIACAALQHTWLLGDFKGCRMGLDMAGALNTDSFAQRLKLEIGKKNGTG